jgi:DNA polymerase-3 subunit alpha
MPDIDVDFCFERRGEVIEYVRQKYGRDSVGQIITFGTMKSRAVVKDVGRVLGFTPAETDALAKLIPNQPNFFLTVADAVKQVPEVKSLYKNDERYTQLLDYAIALEGLSRHAGVHAAGVVIAPGPLVDYVPVCTQTTKGSGAGDEETVVVTQYDMTSLEKAGMLKMDFLGLTTLTVIHDALVMIEARGGGKLDLEKMPLDDPATYRILRAGRTAGVFQFESALATDMLRNMRCDRFDDLVASNALMRPGPLDAGMHKVYVSRKRGDEPVSYPLPELRDVLEPTYGVITYQEQVMRIAQILAGISLSEADVLRKAVGKKDAELIKAELNKFVEKAVERGHPRRIIEEIAGQLETFGRYGFNKSHSVAYSILAYQTAWLKTHHPAEFMAALLSSQIGDADSVVKYINEARELGLEVLPPDVNESGYKFTVVGDKRVRFGLGAIRNVGRGAIDSILAARKDGTFDSFFDFVERVDLRICNRRVFEALIASGALDSLGGHRFQYLSALDGALHEAALRQEEKISGQTSLFGEASVSSNGEHTPLVRALPNVQPFTDSERLAKEKEILGFYISGHPLEPFRTEAELFASHTVSQLGAWTEQTITLGVVVTAIKKQISKRSGAEFARLTVEDFSGSSEVLVFPEAWTLLKDRAKPDIPVLLKGSYSKRDQGVEHPTFIIESLTPFVELRAMGNVAVAIELPVGHGVKPAMMKELRDVAEVHAGSAPLELRWKDDTGGTTRLRSRTLKIAVTSAALSELRALVGESHVKLVKGN